MGKVSALEAEREAAEQGFGMARRDKLVPGGAPLLLGALGRKQVPEARRAAHELSAGGQLEALGDGLVRLLHEESGRTHRVAEGLARGKSPPGRGPGRCS